MAGTEILMTAEALDRLQKVTRTRERARIAEQVEVIAAEYNGGALSDRLYAFAEELRTNGVPVKVLPDPIADTLAAEIDALNGGVPVIAHDPSSGLDDDGLPEVHHLDDEEMAVGIVNNRVRRGIAQGMRD